jgi:hypothetical protein
LLEKKRFFFFNFISLEKMQNLIVLKKKTANQHTLLCILNKFYWLFKLKTMNFQFCRQKLTIISLFI